MPDVGPPPIHTPPFTWSYTHITNFEKCPKRYCHVYVLKDVVEDQSPALIEGDMLHKAFDARLAKGTPLPLAYAVHEDLLTKVLSIPGKLSTEVKLGMNEQFQATTFMGKGVWMRSIMDATKIEGTWGALFDWKTGKRDDDTTQLMLMSTALFAHQPHLMRIKAALVYLNHNSDRDGRSPVVSEVINRGDLKDHWADFMPRLTALKHARETMTFPPRPECHLCRKYCPVTSCPFHGRGI